MGAVLTRTAPPSLGREVLMKKGMTTKKYATFGGTILNGIVSFFDLIIGSFQKLVGIKGMPYFFVLPNLLIFGIFILFPMLLNFVSG
jgi:hypothetical protein